MKNSRLLGAVCAFLCATAAQASPGIDLIDLTIDKADYSRSYSVGVEAYISSDLPLLDVTATHDPYTSGSSGTWALENLGGNRWWAWDESGRAPYSGGAIDGLVTVTASDGTNTSSSSIEIPPDAELDFITGFQFLETTLGYETTANPVVGADYYHLWVWDDIDEQYVFTQNYSQINELNVVPYANLQDGREYRFYLIANNPFSGGLFRTNTVIYVTPSFITVDIKPSKKPENMNVIDTKKDKNLKVAILGSETFDALQVDPTAVQFGPGEASPARFKGQDYNRDGYSDLILTFKLKETGIACGVTEATLIGQTNTTLSSNLQALIASPSRVARN